MENSVFVCPLCCGKTFNSRQDLSDHLVSYTRNFKCMICLKKFSSIDNLAVHLGNKCSPCSPQDDFNKNISKLEIDVPSSNHNFLIVNGPVSNNANESQHTDFEREDYQSNDVENIIKDGDNESVLSVELSKEDSNLMQDDMDQCIQSEELKLMEEVEDNKYLLLGSAGTSTLISDSTVITKQNSDGTISLLSLKTEEKPEEKTCCPTTEEKEIGSDFPEELYSCSSCGVSFTSVLEHIQTYHNDQEVVLEVSSPDALTEDVVNEQAMTVEYPAEVNAKNIQQKHNDSIRRVITESGDIVTDYTAIETDSVLKKNASRTLLEQEVVDETGQVYTRKLVKIDKFWGNHDQHNNGINKSLPVKEELKLEHPQQLIKKIKLADDSGDMYHCVLCNMCTYNEEEFDKHVCKLKYSCPHCPVAYGNPKSLCAHMKVHKTEKQSALKALLHVANAAPNSSAGTSPTGPFRCEVCYTVFPSNKSLRLHRRMHDPIKARPIEPPVESGRCGSVSSPETFHCGQCDKFIPVGYKKVHLNYHRSSNSTYNCDICNRKFNSDDFLAMHMKIHNIDKGNTVKQGKTLPYSCSFCTRQFARPHEKVKHERIHTGEKPHSCEICGKSFRVSYCLTLHMRTHTGMRPYGCSHCGKRFKAHSVYNHHLLTHSDVRAYKCPYCPKAFKTSVQLAGHKNSHTKPYSCTHCNRPFASLYAVRVHTDSHRRSNNLKFSCSLCGASYARTFALKDHMKQAHQTDVEADDNADGAEKDWNVPHLDGMMSSDINNEIRDMAMDANEADPEMIIGLVPSIDNKS